MNAIPLEQEMEYPSSDGQPMAEGPEHLRVMIDLISGLMRRYAKAPDVWAGGNFLLYYEKGNPKARVSPDVLVAKGVVKEKPGLPPNLWVKTLSSRLGRVAGGPHDPALVGAWQLSATHPGLGKGSIALVLPPAG